MPGTPQKEASRQVNPVDRSRLEEADNFQVRPSVASLYDLDGMLEVYAATVRGWLRWLLGLWALTFSANDEKLLAKKSPQKASVQVDLHQGQGRSATLRHRIRQKATDA